MTLPLEFDGPPLTTPGRKGVRGGGDKPEWTEYRVQTPVRCDHCLQVAHATLLAGKPHEGLRDAKFKRRHGADVLLLCHEHANAVRDADRVEFAGVAAVRSSGGRVMS